MNKTANQVRRNREPLAGVREEVERLEFCLEGLFAFATDYPDIIELHRTTNMGLSHGTLGLVLEAH